MSPAQTQIVPATEEETEMPQSFHSKIVHITDDGDKLEFTASIEAEGHDAAVAATRERLEALVRMLAAGAKLSIDGTKVELRG